MGANVDFRVGDRVRVARPGRRVAGGHVPCRGAVGVLVGHYPDDPCGYVYAVEFPFPEDVGGMVLAYQADELEAA